MPWLLFKAVQFVWKCIWTLSLLMQISRQQFLMLPDTDLAPLKPNLWLTDHGVELSENDEQCLIGFSVFDI